MQVCLKLSWIAQNIAVQENTEHNISRVKPEWSLPKRFDSHFHIMWLLINASLHKN